MGFEGAREQRRHPNPCSTHAGEPATNPRHPRAA